MSKNKALNFVGVYLPDDVFAYEQLCVAISRVMSLLSLTFYVNDKDGYLRNIV